MKEFGGMDSVGGMRGVGESHDPLQKTDNPIRGKRGLALRNSGSEDTYQDASEIEAPRFSR